MGYSLYIFKEEKSNVTPLPSGANERDLSFIQADQMLQN